MQATPPSSPLITLRSLIYHLSSFFHATSLASFTFHAFADDWLSLPLDAQEDAQNAFEEAGVPLIRLPGKSRERLEKYVHGRLRSVLVLFELKWCRSCVDRILLVDLFTSLLDAYSKSSDKSTHSSSPLPLKHHSVVFVVPEPSSCVDAIAALRARGARVIMVVANEAQRRACIGHVEQTFLWEELLRQPVALVKKPRSFSARLETERKEHLEEPEVHNVTANGPSQHDKAAWEHLYGDEIEGSPIEECAPPCSCHFALATLTVEGFLTTGRASLTLTLPRNTAPDHLTPPMKAPRPLSRPPHPSHLLPTLDEAVPYPTATLHPAGKCPTLLRRLTKAC